MGNSVFYYYLDILDVLGHPTEIAKSRRSIGQKCIVDRLRVFARFISTSTLQTHAQQTRPLFLYVLSDPDAQLRYGGSGERFLGFVEYSARRLLRCRIPGRRCPQIVLRR